MESIRIEIATIESAREVMKCTNDAFMADSFFKKEEFHQRFTISDVEEHMRNSNSLFLIASSEAEPGRIVGSILMNWTSSISNNFETFVGHFSAVSVPPAFAKRGIGKKLVQTAEQKLLEISTKSTLPSKVVMEMGVINLREDLFPWYESQGYSKHERLPDSDELARIKLDEVEVYCILMQKQLRA